MISSSSSSRIASPPRSDSIPRITGDTDSGSARPRNRRLISTEQELVNTSRTNTPGGSRGVSPIPQKHPSRVSSGGKGNGNANAGGSRARGSGRPVGGLLAPTNEAGKGGRGSPVGVGGIWDGGWMSSWSALQGIASSVLGGTEGEGRKSSTERNTWGPEALPKQHDGGIGLGSTAERDAIVRRKKMTRVLEGRDERPNMLDTNGNYKQRTSMEDQRPRTPQDDTDALVYIHHVQSNDTLAGVVLRYSCQPAIFRKANRFWPNDSIQVRKIVVLPVDACAVKGRPCDPPSVDGYGIDLLAPTPGVEEAPPFPNTTWPEPSSTHNKTSAARSEVDENPWVHVRWVLLDSSPHSKPVEIGRMPRKTLGYFPPRRRKSQASISTISTPRVSSDFPRLSQSLSQTSIDPIGSAASTPPRQPSNFGSRPSIPGSYFPPSPMISSVRSRRESVSEAAGRLSWLQGPGGVGTLGKNVRKPGPGNDGMNSWVKRHIPGLAIDDLPSTSVLGAETAHFGFSEELASIAEGPAFNNSNNATGSTAVLGPNGLGLENAAAAIEGWVRRMAVKGPVTPKAGIRSSEPDLIELLDGTGSDDGRGFELSPGKARASTPIGSGREDLDNVIRGRGRAGTKGGKSD